MIQLTVTEQAEPHGRYFQSGFDKMVGREKLTVSVDGREPIEFTLTAAVVADEYGTPRPEGKYVTLTLIAPDDLLAHFSYEWGSLGRGRGDLREVTT
jgi:hypothetical protein